MINYINKSDFTVSGDTMDELNKQILDEIKKSKEGTSCLQLSKKLNKNRITVAKYLEILKANGLVESRQVAQANIWMMKSDTRTKILIVDDEPNIVTLIKLSLSGLDTNIICAYDGLEGLQKVYEEKPNIIILDLMMPKMSGYDVYEKLKGSGTTRDIPVIVLTAKSDISKKINNMLVNKDMFMTKPFDPIELETNIKLLLSTKDDVHPITRLPNERAIIDKVEQLLVEKKSCNVCIIKLEGLSALKKTLGFTKINSIIEKFANVITEAVKEKFIFLGQVKDDTLVLIATTKVNEEVKKAYDTIAQYLTSEEMTLVVDEYDNRELKSTDLSKLIK
jgi:CheY-like chemotaxis protein